jgi:hypothetical protein
MTPNLHKILKAFAKELTLEVTKEVTQRLRESYVDDVSAIVKEYLKSNEVYSNSGAKWISLANAAKNYGMSIKSVGRKCQLFKTGEYQIERKWIGGHNMLNEAQFLEACTVKMGKPKFLENLKKVKNAA